MTEGQKERLNNQISAKEAVRKLLRTYALRDTSWAYALLEKEDISLLRDLFSITDDDIGEVLDEYIEELFLVDK